MPHFLSDDELQRTVPAETATFASPVPTQIVSNGEYNPLPQTREQARVEARIKDLADRLAPRHGMDRRRFLASTAGMAAAFLAMNEVFGPLFDVSRAEAQTPGVADQRAGALAGQFIFDDQVHFVRDDFNHAGLLDLAKYARQNWNPALAVHARLVLAPRRREAHVPVLREGREGGHQHHLHPQGAPARGLPEVLGTGVAVQHRVGRGEGGEGLAADELRDLSLRPPDVPGATGRHALGLPADRPD